MAFEIYHGARVPMAYAAMMRRVEANIKKRNAVDSITLPLAEDEEEIIKAAKSKSSEEAPVDVTSTVFDLPDVDLEF